MSTRPFGLSVHAAVLALLGVLVVLPFAGSGCHSAGRPPAGLDSATSRGALPDGIYAVLRGASTADSVGAASSSSAVLAYDHKYTEASPDEPIEYLALDSSFYVPLIIEGKPETTKDGNGFSMLSVTLAKDASVRLEQFTAKHLGGRVAIVIGGEVVTTHKVRAVVRGGKLQITRCGDNACEVLLTKLAK